MVETKDVIDFMQFKRTHKLERAGTPFKGITYSIPIFIPFVGWTIYSFKMETL